MLVKLRRHRGIAFAAPFADLAGLPHGSACQVDEFDVVSAGCFVTSFCDDRLGARAANLLQTRDLALEGAHRLFPSRALVVRATAMSWQKSLARP